MSRFSPNTIVIAALGLSFCTLGFGCALIAGIEDRGDARVGTGGAGSGTSSSGSSASSASSGVGAGPNTCGSDVVPPPSPLCDKVPCPTMGDLNFNGCHCGQCNRECGSGVATGCMMGMCKPKPMVVLPNRRIHRAAVNGMGVFFPSFDDAVPTSQIHFIPFNDGMFQPMPVTKQDVEGYVFPIAADCDRIYFATRSQGSGATEAIYRVAAGGGTPEQLPRPTPDNDVGGVETIVFDQTKVVWTDFRGVGVWLKNSAEATRVPNSGTAGYNSVGLALDHDDLYWSEFSPTDGTSRIHHGVVTAGGVTADATFLEYKGTARHLAVDMTRIYWKNTSDTNQDSIQWILRGDLGTGNPKPLFALPVDKELGEPILADYDGGYVYFIETDPQSFKSDTFRAPKPSMTMMAPQPISVEGFDEQWLVGDTKRIYMVTPKNGFPMEVGQIDWVAR